MSGSMLISEQLRDKIWDLFTDGIYNLGAAGDVWHDHYQQDVRNKLNELLGAKETDEEFMDN